jgi:hypothetical protein
MTKEKLRHWPTNGPVMIFFVKEEGKFKCCVVPDSDIKE